MDSNTPNTQEAVEHVAPEQGDRPSELSRIDRIAEVLKRHEAGAATDSAPEEPKEPEAVEEPAAEVTEAAKGEVETPVEEPKEEAPEPYTAEQLADQKFWDRLDKAGWERAEKLHPVETARVKAAYAAASRIVAAAQKEAKSQPAEEVRTTQQPTSEAGDMKALLAKLDSLDDEERAEALTEFVKRQVADLVPQLTGIKPEAVRAQKIEASAYQMAVAAMPELAGLQEAELDAAVESDPDLMSDVQLAVSLPEQQATQLIASVMRRAGRNVIAAKQAESAKAEAVRKAEAAKASERQARVRANANNPSSVIQENTAARVPTGKRSAIEIYEANLKRLGG